MCHHQGKRTSVRYFGPYLWCGTWYFLKLVEERWYSRSIPALCWGSKLFSGASTGQGGRLLLSRRHSWQTDERKSNEALVHEQTTSALIAHNKILPAGALPSITSPKRERLRCFYLRGEIKPLHVQYTRAEWVWKSLWPRWSKLSLDAFSYLTVEAAT